MRQINESDWKLLQRLKPLALGRLCERFLKEVKIICSSGESPHQRFLKTFSEIQKGDEAIARGFNDFRRSTAVVRLAVMKQENLITGPEFSAFSEETRKSVNTLIGI